MTHLNRSPGRDLRPGRGSPQVGGLTGTGLQARRPVVRISSSGNSTYTTRVSTSGTSPGSCWPTAGDAQGLESMMFADARRQFDALQEPAA